MATSKLYLLNWNVYYNKRVKIIQVSDLGQAFFSQSNINFNPGDGVNTSQILNYSETRQPDYLVETQVIGGVERIKTRWYVIEAERTRLNQYNVILRRDLLADYWSDVSVSPAFIRKGLVLNDNDLIFNSEGTRLNQIKQNEILLQDVSYTPWIVGYIASNGLNDAKTIKTKIPPTPQVKYDSDEALLAAYPGSTIGTPAKKLGTITYSYLIQFNVGFYTQDQLKAERSFWMDDKEVFEVSQSEPLPSNSYVFKVEYSELEKDLPDAIYDFMQFLRNFRLSNEKFASYFNSDEGLDPEEEIKCSSSEGLIVQTGANNYYQMSFDVENNYTYTFKPLIANAPKLMNHVNDMLLLAQLAGFGTKIDNIDRKVTFSDTSYRWSATWINAFGSYTTGELSSSNKNPCNDAPYYMFCIPYKAVRFWNGKDIVSSKPSIALSLANQMIRDLGSSLYDLQLLPYFPTQEIIFDVGDQTGYVNLQNIPTAQITYITNEANANDIPTFIYWPSQTNFTVNLPYKIATWTNLKAQNETQMARLCSPNYASQFEFSPAKNRGVESFIAQCTYKPYNPYIQVAPKFNGLYGQDFSDARGLICAGDFSMNIESNAFVEYELRNKNYNAIFNRQIESMDLKHDIAETQDVVNAITGTIGAIGAGAAAGSKGGAIGAIAGGVIGGVASGISGAYDISAGKRLRADEADSARTIQSLSIGNIQATPNTLTKVTAMNVTNKLYPFVEIYGCSQIELDRFVDQIKYSGMTVGVIDQVSRYSTPSSTAATNYIEADIIRLDIPDDSHIVSEIANELRKGVYLEKL